MTEKSNQIRANRVLGFFVAKGYLVAPQITPVRNIKLDIEDVVFIADNLEPRVWEVLPAALISFPASFLRKENLPEDFLELLESLKKDEESEQLFRGIAFKAFKRWMKLTPTDKRKPSYSSK